MTDPRRQRFAPYLRSLADRMGLRDWTVRIDDGPPQPNGAASVRMTYGQKVGTVYLSEAFLEQGPEDQRDDLVHELVHLHFAAQDGLVEDWLTAEEYQGYVRIWEYGIDGVARAWAPLLPLPGDAGGAPVRRPRR